MDILPSSLRKSGMIIIYKCFAQWIRHGVVSCALNNLCFVCFLQYLPPHPPINYSRNVDVVFVPTQSPVIGWEHGKSRILLIQKVALLQPLHFWNLFLAWDSNSFSIAAARDWGNCCFVCLLPKVISQTTVSNLDCSVSSANVNQILTYTMAHVRVDRWKRKKQTSKIATTSYCGFFSNTSWTTLINVVSN